MPSVIVARSVEDLAGVSGEALPRAAVAVGNLDGFHRGHQALIASAQAAGGTPAVLTFSPHPQEVLLPSSEGHRLTTDAEKFELLEKAGVECILALRFDLALAAQSPEAFFCAYLENGLRASSVHVGDDFRFGSRRSGDTRKLATLGASAGISVHVIPPVEWEGERISSSRIREGLKRGNVAEAAELLGRPYFLVGRVEPGAGRGRQLGIPTANVAYAQEKFPPKLGVYATRVQWKGRSYASVSNYGTRPTFTGSAPGAPVLETHLLDFQQDLYGENVKVEFLHHVRDEKRFDGVEALRAQVAADIDTVRKMV